MKPSFDTFGRPLSSVIIGHDCPEPSQSIFSDTDRQAILKDFNGNNHYELAVKHNVGLLDIYAITRDAHRTDQKAGFLKAVNEFLAAPVGYLALPDYQRKALIRLTRDQGEIDAADKLEYLCSGSRPFCAESAAHLQKPHITAPPLALPEFQAVLQASVLAYRQIQSFIVSFYKRTRSLS